MRGRASAQALPWLVCTASVDFGHRRQFGRLEALENVTTGLKKPLTVARGEFKHVWFSRYPDGLGPEA